MLAQWACIVTMSQEKYIVELKMALKLFFDKILLYLLASAIDF